MGNILIIYDSETGETGHFPFFEDPDQLEVTLLKILSCDVK
jgi:hypothetical protein